jgi:transporter family protein
MINIASWQWFALGSAFFAGLTALFAKMGVKQIPSNLATFFRTIIIMLMVGAILTLRREWQRVDHLDSKSLLFLFLSAIATGLSWLCYYRALQLGPVAKVATIDKLSVAIAIFLAWVVLGEKVTLLTVFGSLLIALGTVLVSL